MSCTEEQLITTFNFLLFQWTWADIYFVAITELLDKILPEVSANKYSNIKALAAKIYSLHGIKEYRATRPITEL